MTLRRWKSVAVVALALTLAVPIPALAAAPEGSGDTSWIVVMEPNAHASDQARAAVASRGGRVDHVYSQVINGFSFTGSAAAAEALRRNPNVASVSATRQFSTVGETGPHGVLRIGAWGANQAGYNGTMSDGTPVRIAVLDTGVLSTHADLAPNLTQGLGINCVGSGPPDDGHSHGTHVSGSAAAALQGEGIIGVATDVEIVPVKVMTDGGTGSDAQIICGLEYVYGLISQGVPIVVNMSIGDVHTEGSACSSSPLHQAICNVDSAGVPVVAAAGNNGQNAATFFPAAYPETIAVSALADFDHFPGGLAGCRFLSDVLNQCDDTIAGFSNWGSVIDVMAPGVSIYSTNNNGGYVTKSGTSMASPHVAGVVALMRAENPTLPTAAIRTLLQQTGECPNGEQSGAATCTGKGNWVMSQPLGGTGPDPDGIPEPLVNALRAADAAAGNLTTFPDVTVTAPAAGSLVSGTVAVDVDASDATGVASVELFIDGVAVGVDTTAPYTFAWDSTAGADGAHSITAEATSTSGGSTTSTAVAVSVDNTAPSVAVTAPPDGAIVSGVVDITADAADDSGVAQVEFFVDDSSLGVFPGVDPVDGYLDVGLARVGQPARSGVDKDVPHPVASHELRLDVVMASLNNNANMVAVNAGSKRREWALTTSGGGSTVTYAASANGTSWGQVLQSSAVLSAGSRVQLRVVHAGSAVSIYARDPAVDALDLGSDAGWTLVAEDTTAAVGVADIPDQPNAPMDLFTRLKNTSSGMPYQLYEFEYRVDGVVVSHIVGDDVVIDAAADQFLDEQGNVWSWGSDTDPTVVPGIDGSYGAAWDATAEPPGAYTLRATATDAAGLTASDTVTVTVEEGPSIPTVAITAPTDGEQVSGAVSVTAGAASDVGVAQVEFFADGASLGVDATVPYSTVWDTTTHSDGVVAVDAVVTDVDGGGATDSISVTVVNTAPDVTITSPVDGAFVTGTVDVSADASAPTGVTRVEFFVDGASVGVDDTAPYVASWDSTTAADGSVDLTAVATDGNGTDKTSSTVTVTVDNTAPSVAVTSPTDGTGVSGAVDLVADASDAAGIVQVEFFVDGTSVGSAGSAPYTVAWDSMTASNGQHQVTAAATDGAGLVATSAGVTVDVDNGSTGGPPAFDGYLDVGLARVGQPARSGVDKDLPHPVASHELRLDVLMDSLNNNANMVAVNGGSKKREWALTTSGGGSTVTYAASANGRSWGEVVQSSAVLTAGSRVQLRVVHDGSSVAIYSRDPAEGLALGSDASWVLIAEDLASAVSVGEIPDQTKAPLDLFTRLKNTSSGMPYQLFEFEYRVDGAVVSHIVGGDVVLDATANQFPDEQGNVWGWGSDTDPTVVPNTPG